MFNLFIERLKLQFDKPLPGEVIQYEMASSNRKSILKQGVKNDEKQSAVCLLLYFNNNSIFLPLIERTEYKGVHSGQIALPGGKVEQYDNDYSETAIRELGEETGYISSNLGIIGKLTEVYIPPSNFLVHPYVAYTNEIPKFSHDEKEVNQLIYLNLSDLINDQIMKEKEINLANNLKIKAPYFDIQNKVVWGATAMILNEFKNLVKRDEVITSFLSQ